MTSTDYQIETLQREIRDLQRRLAVLEARQKYSNSHTKTYFSGASTAVQHLSYLLVMAGIAILFLITVALNIILLLT